MIAGLLEAVCCRLKKQLDKKRNKIDKKRMSIFQVSDRTLSVSVLVLPEASMMCVASVLDPLRAANRVSGQMLFDRSLYSLDGEPVPLTCAVPLHVEGRFEGHLRGDLLIVVAGFNQQLHVNSASLARIKSAASGFKAVAGVEAGTWILARAGLLNGHLATTHWEDFEAFTATFPDVEVKTDRFVIDGNTMTCGGASPALDMMLQLIRLRHGTPLALNAASVFVYDEAHAQTDAQPLVSLGRLVGTDRRLETAIRMMEERIEQPLPIAALAQRVHVSTRTLENIFRQSLGQPPGKYYLGLRLQSAFRMVSDSDNSIHEIAIRTGFGSLSAFSRAYSKRFGISPKRSRVKSQVKNLR